MLGRDFEGKAGFLEEHSNIYSEQDYLKPGSVNAYVCKNGTLQGCPVDEKGMDIESFDETIDEINRISDQLDCAASTFFGPDANSENGCKSYCNPTNISSTLIFKPSST